jgi:uncharacterized protein (DUF1015 family)
MLIIDLPIVDLVQDSLERSRPHLNPDQVSYYIGHLDESAPVVIYQVNGLLLLADGHHRVAAALQLGRPTVRAEVREGQRSDALQFAVEHGQQQRGLTKEQILDAIERRDQRPEG